MFKITINPAPTKVIIRQAWCYVQRVQVGHFYSDDGSTQNVKYHHLVLEMERPMG